MDRGAWQSAVSIISSAVCPSFIIRDMVRMLLYLALSSVLDALFPNEFLCFHPNLLYLLLLHCSTDILLP